MLQFLCLALHELGLVDTCGPIVCLLSNLREVAFRDRNLQPETEGSHGHSLRFIRSIQALVSRAMGLSGRLRAVPTSLRGKMQRACIALLEHALVVFVQS